MALGDEQTFPRVGKGSDAGVDIPGMTYRQWLAGMALQGVLANPENGGLQPEELADLVQRITRAMLKPRPAPGGSQI